MSKYEGNTKDKLPGPKADSGLQTRVHETLESMNEARPLISSTLVKFQNDKHKEWSWKRTEEDGINVTCKVRRFRSETLLHSHTGCRRQGRNFFTFEDELFWVYNPLKLAFKAESRIKIFSDLQRVLNFAKQTLYQKESAKESLRRIQSRRGLGRK